MFSIAKNLTKSANMHIIYNTATKMLSRSAFSVVNHIIKTQPYLFEDYSRQGINYSLLKNRFAQISTATPAINAVQIEAINQQLWINSDFYKSYKYSPENWDIDGVITKNKGKYDTNCICIDRVVSLYNNELLPRDINDLTTINEFENVGSAMVFGELADSSTFFIEYYIKGDNEFGNIKIAHDWGSLIDNIDDNSLYIFIKYMHKKTQKQIRYQIDNNPNDQNVREILKANFGSVHKSVL